MRQLIPRLAGVLALIAAFLVGPLSAETVRAADIYVIDGDTIDHNGQRYRLVGFDTPETYHPRCKYEADLGALATSRVKSLLSIVAIIDLAVLPGHDRYGRGLARLSINTTDLGAILINDGLALPYRGGRRPDWCAFRSSSTERHSNDQFIYHGRT